MSVAVLVIVLGAVAVTIIAVVRDKKKRQNNG